MQLQDHLDKIWLIYYGAGAVLLLCVGLLTWRIRYAFINIWFPFLVFVITFVPLPAGDEGQHVAPMIGVWLMRFFGG